MTDSVALGGAMRWARSSPSTIRLRRAACSVAPGELVSLTYPDAYIAGTATAALTATMTVVPMSTTRLILGESEGASAAKQSPPTMTRKYGTVAGSIPLM